MTDIPQHQQGMAPGSATAERASTSTNYWTFVGFFLIVAFVVGLALKFCRCTAGNAEEEKKKKKRKNKGKNGGGNTEYGSI